MENLDISCYAGSDDMRLFKSIINQGIDARLEAFTKSKFVYVELGTRLHMDIEASEIPIFLRRLNEIAEYDDNADGWETDIINVCYGIEIY